jgi:hypothetical protein
MTMKIILLRGVAAICLVDICHRIIYLLDMGKEKLRYKFQDGGLIWNISTLFQHK